MLRIGFLFFRPAGVIPETRTPRRRHDATAEPSELAEEPANGSENRRSSSNWLHIARADGDARPAGEQGDILVVDDIHRDFGGVRAVDGATFSVERGSITGLIGPNGAGRSTALAIVSGFVRAGARDVSWPCFRWRTRRANVRAISAAAKNACSR